MRLLVSVANAAEAAAALTGGADIVDAKDPARGALGAVALSTFRQICDVSRTHVPISAALGDASSSDGFSDAPAYARAGASFVKIGVPGVRSAADATGPLTGYVRAVAGTGAALVAVAYVDEGEPHAIAELVLRAAATVGAGGVLLDTANKNGPALRDLMSPEGVATWVAAAHDAGLVAAVGGRLTGDDFGWLASTGVDIVGVRGAACDAGRLTSVRAARVSDLRARLRAATRATPATATTAAAPA